MEVHDRFMKLPITVVRLIESLEVHCKKKPAVMTEIVETYNNKIYKNVYDMETLETYRMMLCYEYQSFVKSLDKDKPIQNRECRYINFEKFFLIDGEYRSEEELTVIFDIVILQLVLYSSKSFIPLILKDSSRLHESSSTIENLKFAMRLCGCFADSYNLYTYLYKSTIEPSNLEECSTLILNIIQAWIKQEEHIEWKLLASLLPKLILTFSPETIVSPLWELTFNSAVVESILNPRDFGDINDFDKKLAMLCVMADVCFPLDAKEVKELHYEQCIQHEFWWILSRGLISTVLGQRKQALYLLKRVVDFVETHETELKRRLDSTKARIMPFVCTKSTEKGRLRTDIKKYFFLLLEVLEEKQKHLVLPALSQLSRLKQVHGEDETYCDCFNLLWLRCIYRRIVQHDNDTVKIYGLQEILKSDHCIFFDEEFLHFVVGSLNSTFLYEYSIDGTKPEIVKDLVECLSGWERKKIPLINSFIHALSTISWGPVAIYWILVALLEVSKCCKIDTNKWKDPELRCIENLSQKCLLTHNLHLRIYSQVLMIQLLQAYTLKTNETSAVKNILNIISLFHENENLKHHATIQLGLIENLPKIINHYDAQQYVVQTCQKLLSSEQNLKFFAFEIILLVNSKLIITDRGCPAKNVLQSLFHHLNGASQRLYADRDAVLKIVELWGHLVFFCSPQYYSTTSSCETPCKLITDFKTFLQIYQDEILKIVEKSLERRSSPQYEKYLSVIHSTMPYLNTVSENLSGSEVLSLADKCFYIIVNPHEYSKTQWLDATEMLYGYTKYNTSYRQKFLKHIPALLSYFRNEIISSNQKMDNVHEEISRKLVLDSSKIMALVLELGACEIQNVAEVYDYLLLLVETGNELVAAPVASTILILLSSQPPSSECLHTIIQELGKCIFQLKKTSVFFTALDKFTKVVLNKKYLQLVEAQEYVPQFVDQMMLEGESVPMMKKIFLDSISNLGSEEILRFLDAFMSCLLHGRILRRDQRIERATVLHGAEVDFAESFQMSELNNDATIRAVAVGILLRILSNEVLYKENERKFPVKVMNYLLKILHENKNKRYFDNSQLHRLKHRVMQSLLILGSFLNTKEKMILHDSLCDLLVAESNQPSVRLMQEWSLIKLYVDSADLRDVFWIILKTVAEKRPGSIVSLAGIAYHVSHQLSGLQQKEFIAKAILQLLPNCMGQQFNVRLYSQAVLVQIYELLPTDSSEAKMYKEIYESVKESLRRGNLAKNSKRVLDDFYFNIFNPERDYNMETIYYELPRLTNMSADEWIPREVLYIINDCIKSRNFTDSDYALKVAKPITQCSKETGEVSEEADSPGDNGSENIQKKIIPWKTMIPFYDDLSETSKAKLVQQTMQNEENGIIVVASLIDRPTNLGGLARTCEIFGAKEFVIGSLRYVEDREFQTLSVSAEKWITIREVKRHLLKKFLLERQSQGWKLIGAEQTANSTSLIDLAYPKKTILLLGNEKDGIPANLIPLLDTCVEIPQQGVVRSLNVHVTGAICIWLYTQQHLLQ